MLKHPLLPAHQAVGNDVRLESRVGLRDGRESRSSEHAASFLLISGSNMAGKSTLLRALGLSVVLARAGAPLPAGRVRMSALQIGASIGVEDSLAEGRSKFLAEVERLSRIVALARRHPGQVLFLVDEVLSGTNSADRRVAAEAVVRGLVKASAIGAMSTHDLKLAEIADDAELGGANVHMASADEADPLQFDYVLKAGVNRTTNGLAIVRMLGLIDDAAEDALSAREDGTAEIPRPA